MYGVIIQPIKRYHLLNFNFVLLTSPTSYEQYQYLYKILLLYLHSINRCGKYNQQVVDAI